MWVSRLVPAHIRRVLGAAEEVQVQMQVSESWKTIDKDLPMKLRRVGLSKRPAVDGIESNSGCG